MTIRTVQFICLSGCLIIILCAGLTSCSNKKDYKSPDGYNLNNPAILKLPSELDDISGICYYAKSNSLFAESDQKGCIYKIPLTKPSEIKKWKFSHKKDYEDIVLVDSTFYVLDNNGNIEAVSFVGDSPRVQQYEFPEKNGRYEFESLYYDDTARKLVLVCKDCSVDKSSSTSTYSFDPRAAAYNNSYIMDVSSLATGPVNTRFKPSAAAINPKTNELYILSSVNKLLITATKSGIIKNVYALDPKIFNQPEGITFAPTGNMFISNEAGDIHSANILFYQYKKSK